MFYKINHKSKFLLQNEFYYNDVINNVDMIKMLLKIPMLLNVEYTYNENQKDYQYFDFDNLNKTLFDTSQTKK